jgi:hypothetical protein
MYDRLNKWASLYLRLALGMNKEEAVALLGLSPNFTSEDLKRAYRKLVVKLHPDVNKSPTAHDDLVKVNEAFAILSGNVPSTPSVPEEPEEEDVPMEQPWKHQYYTPRSEYTDAEWWEYQHDPSRQKQYEQEFQDEQEQGRQDWEENEERKYEHDRDQSYDNFYSVKEQIEAQHLSPGKMIAAFARPVEEQLMLLGLTQHQVDVKRFTKKNSFLNKEINAAIYSIINEKYPKNMKWLYKRPGALSTISDIRDYLGRDERLDLDVFIDLLKDGILGYHMIRTRSPEEIMEIYEALKDKLADFLLSDPPVRWRPYGSPPPKYNITDLLWRIPAPAVQMVLDEVKKKVGPNPDKNQAFLIEILENHIKNPR